MNSSKLTQGILTILAFSSASTASAENKIEILNGDREYPQCAVPKIDVHKITIIDQVSNSNTFGNHVKTYNNFGFTSVYSDEIQMVLDQILLLQDNWDGNNASSISFSVFNNLEKFYKTLQPEVKQLISADGIYPSPYGTLVVEFWKENNLISVEIGNEEIGFFTEFEDGDNFVVDSTKFITEELPILLNRAFYKLYS